MDLLTQKLKLSDIPFSFSVDEFIEDLLKDPSFPYREKGEIPFIRKFSVQEKLQTKGLEYGQIKHWISTTTLDTYGEIMMPKGADLKYYKKNPMVLWSHDYREPDNVMGSNVETEVYDKGIMALTQFAMTEEKASQVYRLYKAGHLRAWSVGFIPIKGKKPDEDGKDKSIIIIGTPPDPTKLNYIHEKWRLLEYSAVAVPANPDALTVSVAKSLKLSPVLTEELGVRTDALGDRLMEGQEKKTIIDLGEIKHDKKDEKLEKEEEKKEEPEEKKKTIEVLINRPKYKERWNMSLSKLFDVENAESSMPLKFYYALYEKFLECKVKEIFMNNFSIPSPLLGTYLAGFKIILNDFDLKDTRRFTWEGSEVPPIYEVIKLNSKKSDDFLIDGIRFYDADGRPLIVKFTPDWSGMEVSIITSNKNKEWNKKFLERLREWVHENNFLRGEKFALGGEFLSEPDDNWENLILEAKYKDSIRTSASFLEKKGKNFTGRGLLFIGPPGTGKTKTGRVLMNELDSTFIWVSSRDFRHIGPMRALALGFSLARDLAPSILFLEDIDTWLRGEMEFVTDLIKTEMDGIKQNKGLITIMTSNYPEKLPDALLDRPGRFHHIVNFKLPNKEQRKEMLIQWAGNIEKELLSEIVEKTDDFSGAHLKELVEFAKMIAEEEEIEIGKALIRSLEKLIEQRELIDGIRDNKTDIKSIWNRFKFVEGMETERIEEIPECFKNVNEFYNETQEEIEEETKPSETNHVCRLSNKAHDKYRSAKRNHEGKPYTVRYGRIKGSTKWEEYEYFYPKASWSTSEARSHCNSHDGIAFEAAKKEADEEFVKVTSELWEGIAENIKGLREEILELKEGRVLSSKNFKLIEEAVTAEKKAVEALEAVLKASRKEEESKEDEKAFLDLSNINKSDTADPIGERQIVIELNDVQKTAKNIAEKLDLSEVLKMVNSRRGKVD